jgi:1-deoxy-D-xylulose-5-phosphate synthase
MAITAAMPMGTGLRGFAKKFPERFFDVGITEGHAVSMAGGAAEQGMIPVFAVYSTFLQRSYDMLIQDISMRSEHVVLAVDRAGLVGDDGETHHGVFDVAYLTSIPNMTVLCPASFAELRDMLEYAVETMNSPVAVRYPRGTEGEYTAGGTRSSAIIREGSDYTIVTYGSMINVALGAAKELCTKGISIEIIKLGAIKPIDFENIDRSVAKTGRLLVLEECVMSGCVGEKITAHLAEKRIETHSVILKNLGDNFVTHGTVSQLRELCGIDDKSVADAISADLNKN